MSEFLCMPGSSVIEQERPQASALANPASWLVEALTHSAGEGAVSFRSAMGIPAAWYCVNRISNDVAQLPLRLYEVTPTKARDEDLTHPSGKAMRNTPGSAIGPFHLRKILQTHACLQGNGRAFVEFNGRMEPTDFIPLSPANTTTVVLHNEILGRRQKYHVYFPQPPDPTQAIAIPDDEVLHIYGQSDDGYCGLSLLDILRGTFSQATSGEKATTAYYRHAAVPGIVLEAPPGAFRKEEDARNFIRTFNDHHAGASNQGRAALLREGIKASVLSAASKDAQMAELRNYSVQEIMRVFSMPMVPGMTDSQSYNSLEQLNRAYLMHCLGPWLRIWEEECNRKLLTTAEQKRESYYFEFDTWDLVKPDAAARADMLSKMVQAMVITPNEARDWEGLPPKPGGDDLVNPSTTSGGAASTTESSGASKPEPPADDGQSQMATARLLPVIRAEVRRVREMARKARNFTEWQTSYYAKHEPRLIEVVQSIGGPQWCATEYCQHSAELLSAVAGSVTQSEFSAAIDAETATWEQRAAELAGLILTQRSS